MGKLGLIFFAVEEQEQMNEIEHTNKYNNGRTEN